MRILSRLVLTIVLVVLAMPMPPDFFDALDDDDDGGDDVDAYSVHTYINTIYLNCRPPQRKVNDPN